MNTQLDFVTGDWLVRVEQLHLEHRLSGEVTPLEPRLAALLSSLTARKGALVTKEMLLEEVWEGAVVSDDSIAQAISRLRKILGDDPKSPKYVQTVWKKGYRWLSQVESPNPSKDESVADSLLAKYWIVGLAGIVVVLLLLLFLGKEQPNQQIHFETMTLTSLPGSENKGMLSSDGHNVVFQSRAPNARQSLIKIQNTTASAAQTLECEGQCYAPVFSDDNNRVAFMQMKHEAEPTCDIVVKGLVSGRQNSVASCIGAVYPDLDWHEGSELFSLGMRSKANEPVAIFAIDAEGDRTQQTFPPKGAWGDFDPAFSPDGHKLVFTRAYSEMQHDLFIVENGEERRLTHQRAAIMGATWSPDGQYTIFAARYRVGYRLYQLDLVSGKTELLSIAANEVIEPFVSQNGDLVATTRQFDTDLYQVNLSDDQLSQNTMFDSTHWDLSPAISSDGKQFVFTSNRNGMFQLWLGNLTDSTTRPLTQLDGQYVVAPRFSPDGKRLVFEVHDGQFSQIYTYDLSNSLLLKLTDRTSLNVMPSISADGQWIYFGSNQDGSWQVWRKSLDGGEAEKVTTNGGHTAFESKDGQWLYFNKRNEAGIWRMNRQSKQVTLVTESLGIDDVSAFTLVDAGLVYLNRNNSRFGSVELIDWQGNLKTLYALESPIPRFDPVLSADGQLRALYLVKSQPANSDLIRVSGAFKDK